MRLEIPTCTRCCFCVPLRYGIIVCGYLNMQLLLLQLSALMITALEASISVESMPSRHMMAVYKGVTFYAQVWFSVLLYATEIVFTVILIVGAHLKRMDLIRVFYYYSITTTLAALAVFLVVRYDEYYKDWGHYIFEFSLAFCIFAFQLYLLLLIRSELRKPKVRGQMTFVNHVSEIVVDGPLSEGRNPL